MNHRNGEPRFVLCINNKDFPASLEARKLYRVLPDPVASKHKLVRIVDESGEDYLYPAAYFTAIKLPATVEKALLKAS
jgi:hypothetical protein